MKCTDCDDEYRCDWDQNNCPRQREEKQEAKWEDCQVVGVYKHLAVLVRPCGLRVSRTYVDLIMEGCK